MADIQSRLKAMQTKYGGQGVQAVDGIPPRYQRWRLEDYPVEWQSIACAFLEREGCSLYLHGKVGTRKTGFAVAILKAWRAVHDLRFGWPGIFLPAYKAATVLRTFDALGDILRHEWVATPMLLLDDLGANRATPHLAEQFLFLIEHRYDWEQWTIITSNLDLNAFAVAFDPRAASRLEEGIVMDLGEKDWRRGKGDQR